MNRAGTCLLPLLLVLVSMPAAADRGSIPFEPGVEITEPTQRAFVTWNGQEEILVLSTDLRASRPTKVLEVIPFPAEPKVTKGDVEIFRRANALLGPPPAGPRALSGKAAGRDGPAGRITFHEKIGAHDIRVVRVLDAEGFVTWVREALRKAGVKKVSIPPILARSIEAYLAEGYGWYVFDVVDLGTATRTNDAIRYRFASKAVYYPMKISRTETGQTSVELFVLTPKLLRRFPGLPIDRVEMLRKPVELTPAQVRGLDAESAKLLGAGVRPKLRTWRIRGDIRSFDKDLLAFEK
jgi:hypothetical protein